MFLMIFSHFISAKIFILGKFLLECASPFSITPMRMFLGGLFSTIIYTFTRPQKKFFPKLKYSDIGFIFALGMFYYFFKAIFTFWGMQDLPPGRASFIFNLGPFLTAFLSYIFYHEKMTVKKVLGMILGFVGVGINLLDTTASSYGNSGFGFVSLPEISVFMGVLSNACGLMVIRYLVRVRKLPVLFFNSLAMFGCSLMSIITIYFYPSLWSLRCDNVSKFVWLIILISLLSIITVNLKSILLKKYSATLMTFTSFIMPMFTVVFGALFFDEKITSTFALAFLIVVLGLYIFYSEELRQGYVVKNKK